MAITRVQGANGNNAAGAASTTATGAFASPTTAGNTIIVGLVIDGGIYTSITDTGKNVYRRLVKVPHSNTGTGVEIWIAENITAVASNVVTANQGFNDGAIFAEEWSGLAKLDSLDVTASNAGGSNGGTLTTNASSRSTQYANQLVFAVGELDISGTTNLTVGAGYSNFTTDRSTFIVGAVESRVVSAQGTQTATMGSDNLAVGYAIAMATFSDTALSPFKTNSLRPHPFSPGIAR